MNKFEIKNCLKFLFIYSSLILLLNSIFDFILWCLMSNLTLNAPFINYLFFVGFFVYPVFPVVVEKLLIRWGLRINDLLMNFLVRSLGLLCSFGFFLKIYGEVIMKRIINSRFYDGSNVSIPDYFSISVFILVVQFFSMLVTVTIFWKTRKNKKIV